MDNLIDVKSELAVILHPALVCFFANHTAKTALYS